MRLAILALVVGILLIIVLTSVDAWLLSQRTPTIGSRVLICNRRSFKPPPRNGWYHIFQDRAFQTSVVARERWSMSTNPFLSFGNSASPSSSSSTLPRDVKDAVTKCRQATQEALRNRISRIDVEFPVGTRFGVEKASANKRKRSDQQQPTQEDLWRSDRELARIFVEMFQPVGSERITTIFPDSDLANQAKKIWKEDSSIVSPSRIVALNRRKKVSSGVGAESKKLTKARGFAAKLAAEMGDENTDSSSSSSGPFELPPSTEVALFVAPGPRELVVIDKICQTVGMGTLVVLLNARLRTIPNFGSMEASRLFLDEFVSVFSLSAAPQDVSPNCLLYRAYPGEWVLARKPKVGPPKPILAQSSRPTYDQCRLTYQSLELSEFEQGVENVLGNVAAWFR